MSKPSFASTQPSTDDLLSTTDAFTDAYLECALWSSTDESRDDGGDPLDDNYGPDDIDNLALASAIEDCRDFQKENASDLEGLDLEQAGHDFWLTRNRHGAGFWDRGLGDKGERLTKASHGYGEVCLVVGDDGKVHGF